MLFQQFAKLIRNKSPGWVCHVLIMVTQEQMYQRAVCISLLITPNSNTALLLVSSAEANMSCALSQWEQPYFPGLSMASYTEQE